MNAWEAKALAYSQAYLHEVPHHLYFTSLIHTVLQKVQGKEAFKQGY